MQQAECAHSASEALASSGNINEISATTRRGLIGLIASAGAATISFPEVAGASIIPGLSGEMRAAIAAEMTAERRSDHYHATVYEPRHVEFQAASASVPHTVVDINGIPGVLATWSTAVPSEVAHCRRIAEREKARGILRSPALRLAAAADERDQALADLQERIGLAAAVDRGDELGDAAYQAICTVIDLPARSIFDLRAKLDRAEHHGLGAEEWVCEAIALDIRHLAKAALQ